MNHDSVLHWLTAVGLMEAGEQPAVELLAGGVSSDVMRVDLRRGPVCVKRALPVLKVQAEWRAPVERSAHEVAWIRAAREFEPDAVPDVLAADPERHCFAMPFYPGAQYPNWKEQLRDGVIAPDVSASVGRIVAHVHQGTAHRPDIAAAFAFDADFTALRLDPYLRATAEAQPGVAAQLMALHGRTRGTHLALVHGDISPKNILVGPSGPLLLDAECAWYGDPAFDVAFCLNHFILKSVWRPRWTAAYAACYRAFVETYRGIVAWEPWGDLEGRIASLLPALLLARIDGLSPVEYVTAERDRSLVRDFAIERLFAPPRSLEAMITDWTHRMKSRNPS